MSFKKLDFFALANEAWLEYCPMGRMVIDSIPSQGTYPSFEFDPLLGHILEGNQRQPVDISLSLPPSMSLCLSAMKKNVLD